MLRFISVLCAAALLIPLLSSLPLAAAEPSVSAASAVLYEPSSGRVIYQKAADEPRPMASTTKIMTAIVAAEHCNPDVLVAFPAQAVGIHGSSAYFEAEEQMTIKDLLYALLLQSANDAAVALAILTAGDVPTFAKWMNQKAEELGLQSTHFENPHGLHEQAHYTTAKDLAIMAACALENPILRAILATKRYTAHTSYGTRTFVNHNKLLDRYDGAIGVKTGFTKASGRCLVGAAEREGMTLISVTLQAPNDWADHAALLSYGFSLYERVEAVAPGAFRYRIPVFGGQAPLATLYNHEGFCCVIPRGSGDDLTITPDISAYPIAPLSPDTVYGHLLIRHRGKLLASLPLYADTLF